MDLADDVRATLYDAGSGALTFNAPLGADRAAALVEQLGRAEARSVVDLGCGTGELARLVASVLPDASVVGVDVDESAVESARRLTIGAPFADRIRFEVGDATTWRGSVDSAICVGTSHAFGGPTGTLSHMATLVATGCAIVGDSVWEATPDPWCLDAFGEQPYGVDGLASMAVDEGWTVVDSGLSTQAEWDTFEGTWIDGVRSVGTVEARAFADEREREYREHYRGVLGFCWLVLSR